MILKSSFVVTNIQSGFHIIGTGCRNQDDASMAEGLDGGGQM
jgi:hypothetical protein